MSKDFWRGFWLGLAIDCGVIVVSVAIVYAVKS